MPTDKHRCSFCGKRADEVAQLIAGSGHVFICDECIDLCHSRPKAHRNVPVAVAVDDIGLRTARARAGGTPGSHLLARRAGRKVMRSAAGVGLTFGSLAMLAGCATTAIETSKASPVASDRVFGG